MDNRDYVKEFEEIIIEVSKSLGETIDPKSFDVIDRGVPHSKPRLPKDTKGVYTFSYNNGFLKIGKASSNSNARFSSQHYKPNSSNSNLAKSILIDASMSALGLDEDTVGPWIMNNCRRIDIILDANSRKFALELIEAALHYKYAPKYEGPISHE